MVHNHIRLLSSLKCSLFIFAFSSVIQAANVPLSFDHLTLEISSERYEYFPLEPIEVTVTLHNATDQPVLGHYLIDTAGLFEFMIGQNESDLRLFKSANEQPNARPAQPHIFLPAEDRSVREVLSYGWHDDRRINGLYLFDKPGIWYIKGALEDLDRTKRIESNTITIRVVAPSSDDAEALAYLSRYLDRENLLMKAILPWPSKMSNETVGVLKQLIEKHPDSRYAQYARKTLGSAYILGYGGNRSEGIEILKSALKYDNSWVKKRILDQLVSEHLKMKDPIGAKEYALQLQANFPHSREAEGSIRTVEDYIAKTADE